MEQRRSFRRALEQQTVPCICKGDPFPRFDFSIFSPEKLQEILSDKTLKFRVGRCSSPDLQWEGLCSVQEGKVSDVITWNSIQNCENASEDEKKIQQKLNACCKKHFWLYADYMYMKDLFKNHSEVLKLLDWDSLGFNDKSGLDSTMWFGTAGAHTLCHYDTYGYNIVLQISGSKRWTLFPPSDTECLYPTRIPYEESSVFSEVNINNPDVKKHSRFSSATPYIVTLRAGDMLYVPHHWWHFVENLEMSVSINLWYEAESDSKSRLDEAITRLLIGTCSHLQIPSEVPWLNPNEDAVSVRSTTKNMQYLQQSIAEIRHTNTNQTDKQTHRRTKFLKKDPEHSSSQNHGFSIKPISPWNGEKFGEPHPCGGALECPAKRAKILHEKEPKGSAANNLNYTEFVQCLTHPDVVNTIAEVINKRFIENNGTGD